MLSATETHIEKGEKTCGGVARSDPEDALEQLETEIEEVTTEPDDITYQIPWWAMILLIAFIIVAVPLICASQLPG